MATKSRKRVEADNNAALLRARDGSAFTRCDECSKDVPVALISFHSCSLDAKIKMNLESQVVEQPSEPKKKSTERKKPTSKEPKPKKAKKEKDPNAPKRPPTAFFLFLDDFRKTFKEENPADSKDVKRVAKEGGEKWKSLSEEEKKQYTDRVAELKAEYQKALENYKTIEIEDDEGSSDKDEEENEKLSDKEEDKKDEEELADKEDDKKDDAEKDEKENPDKELEDSTDEE